MEGKVCVVSGATDGIGRVTAEALAREGAEVVIIGRNAAKGADVVSAIKRSSGSDLVAFEQSDLSSQADIRNVAGRLVDRFERIDVLVNNVGGIFSRRQETGDGIEMTFALNHLGYFLLTGLLLDRVKASPAGRIVNVSSEAHRGGQMDLDDPEGRHRYGGWRAYQQSKLANVLFTYRLAERLKGTPVTANCLHPGFVASKFGHNNGGLFAVGLWVVQQLFAISERSGARTSVYLATSAEVAGTSGRYFDKCREAESSRASHDEAVGRRLWELSEALTEFRYG